MVRPTFISHPGNLIICRHRTQTKLGRRRICGRWYSICDSIPINSLWHSSAIRCQIFLSTFIKRMACWLARTNLDLSPMRSCSIHIGAFLQEMVRYQSHVYENTILRIRVTSPKRQCDKNSHHLSPFIWLRLRYCCTYFCCGYDISS